MVNMSSSFFIEHWNDSEFFNSDNQEILQKSNFLEMLSSRYQYKHHKNHSIEL